MKVSLVIFDCDGVLVDSEVLSAQVLTGMLNERGAMTDVDRVMSEFVGKTDADIRAGVTEKYGIATDAAFSNEANERLRQHYLTDLKAMPGIRELLMRLPVPFAVASNSPPAKLGLGLSVTGLFELLYPHIYCARLVKYGKPAPDLFLHVANAFDVAPRNVVVIEDSVSGVTAAKAANMWAIGFNGGSHHGPVLTDKLRHAGADRIVSTMAELEVVLGLQPSMN